MNKDIFMNAKNWQRLISVIRIINRIMRWNTSPSCSPFSHYVSLGNNCLPRTFLTKWGIKHTKAEGEKSMPFDLVWMDAKAINYFLLFGGKDLIKNVKFIEGENVFKREDVFSILFNHDTDLERNLDALKLRYKNRFINFYNIIKCNDNIMFVQVSEDTKHSINDCYDIIAFLRRGKPFHLILIDVCRVRSFDISSINKIVTVIREPYPTNDWIWWRSDYQQSELGIEFDKRLRRRIEAICCPDKN